MNIGENSVSELITPLQRYSAYRAANPLTSYDPEDIKRKEDRLYTLDYHPEQSRLWVSLARFNYVPSGRRSGKTEIEGKRKVAFRAISPPALGGSAYSNPNYFVAAPTVQQAKRIYWEDLKTIFACLEKQYKTKMIIDKSESELYFKLFNNADFWVTGMDRPERIEGIPLDGGVLDEYGNMKPDTFKEHIRASLSDRKGWCSFIGVPEGRNHYYKDTRRAERKALESRKKNKQPVYDTFHWISADILDAEEIAQAREDLDPLTFAQEYEASFITFQGRAYYTFNSEIHAKHPLEYNAKNPLIICFDFNVSPGTASFVQEQELPAPSGLYGTGIIDEVWIERNSNTPLVCDKIVEKYENHQGLVICYGDSTGGIPHSSQTQGSDWAIIRQRLKKVFGHRLRFDVPSQNPRERARVNSVNSRLLSMDGHIRMMVDPIKAPHMVDDFEGVRVTKDGSGQLDKKIDLMSTHLTDGVGYYIDRKFPVVPRTTTSQVI